MNRFERDFRLFLVLAAGSAGLSSDVTRQQVDQSDYRQVSGNVVDIDPFIYDIKLLVDPMLEEQFQREN